MWIGDNLIFLHIPRTGGRSVQNSLIKYNIGHVPSIEFEHAGLYFTENFFPSKKTFTIIRNPYSIFRSFYWLCKTYANNPNIPIFPKGFFSKYSSLSFNSAIDLAITDGMMCCYGGFNKKFINQKTEVFFYEDNPFDDIASFLGIDNISHDNVSSKVENFEWDDDCREKIYNYCYKDFLMFPRYTFEQELEECKKKV